MIPLGQVKSFFTKHFSSNIYSQNLHVYDEFIIYDLPWIYFFKNVQWQYSIMYFAKHYGILNLFLHYWHDDSIFLCNMYFSCMKFKQKLKEIVYCNIYIIINLLKNPNQIKSNILLLKQLFLFIFKFSKCNMKKRSNQIKFLEEANLTNNFSN